MIVKSIRHFTPYFRYIVNYMFNGMPKEKGLRWKIYHNLGSGVSNSSIVSEFEDNAGLLRKRPGYQRKTTFKYHEILAFAKESTPFLTPEKLQVIAKEYLRLRDPKNESMSLCVPHWETNKSIHLHLVISNNHIGSDKADNRMDNSTYYKLRRNIERFMLQRYPELHHSTVYLPEQEIEKLLPPGILEQWKKAEETKKSKSKSFGKQTKKKQVADIVSEILDQSVSTGDFEARINRTEGFKTYSRNGKLSGIVHNRTKYTFKTLGIRLFPENMEVLERLDELEQIEQSHVKEQGKGLER